MKIRHFAATIGQRLRLVNDQAARLIPALLMAAVMVSCTSEKAAPPPDAATLLQRIPEADPAKYSDLRDSKSWRNPYLVIRSDQIGLLTGVAANQERILKPDEVVDVLAHLPATAWPYGRVVAILVSEKPGSSEQDKVELRRKRGVVAGQLQEAKVAIRWMSGA